MGRRFDLMLTIIMALAAVGTAWAGFQSTKWSGVQANSYAQAAAARTESDRVSTLVGQQRIGDVIAFGAWLDALHRDVLAGQMPQPSGSYEAVPGTMSTFLYRRLRPDFRAVVDSWIATQPLMNAGAPATPFEMASYRLPLEERAAEFVSRAESLAQRARAANQQADNYVLTAVIFALVLFFAGVAGRARGRRAQSVLFGLSAVALVAAVMTLATFPVQV